MADTTVNPQATSDGDGLNTETEQGKGQGNPTPTGAGKPPTGGAADPQIDRNNEDDRPIFSQADLKRHLDERMAREREQQDKRIAKAKEEAEREALKQKGEFETLFKQEQERANALEQQIEQARIQGIRARAITTHNLPTEFMDRLIGDDETSIFADAEKVKRLLGVKKAPDNEGGERRETLNDEQRRQANERPVTNSTRYRSL